MQPKRSMLALLLWVTLLYVAPIQTQLRQAFTPGVWAVPTFGVAGLPDPWIMRANPEFAMALVGAYAAIYLLVALVLRICRAYHFDAAVARLAGLTTVKGLRGMDGLLMALLAISAVGFAVAIPFWQSEAVAVLALVSWLVLAGVDRNRPVACPTAILATGGEPSDSSPAA